MKIGDSASVFCIVFRCAHFMLHDLYGFDLLGVFGKRICIYAFCVIILICTYRHGANSLQHQVAELVPSSLLMKLQLFVTQACHQSMASSQGQFAIFKEILFVFFLPKLTICVNKIEKSLHFLPNQREIIIEQ